MSFLIDSAAARFAALPSKAGLSRVGSRLLLAWLPLGCTVMPPLEPAPAPAPAAASVPLPAAPPAPAPVAPPAPVPAPGPAKAPDASTPSDAAARRLLAFNERVRDLGPADLARETVRLGDPTEPGSQLELALVLAQTRQSGDLARALALVEPLARGSNASPWQGLARLLHARLVEQRRLEEQSERQAQQLREQQRRIDQLASQIEALRAIERSLNTRPAAAPYPTPALPPR